MMGKRISYIKQCAQNQRGAIPLLFLVAVVGVLGFAALSSAAPFKNKVLQTFYPKDESFAQSSTALPPLPIRWPSQNLELGMASGDWEAEAMKQTAPFKFRYHYITSAFDTCQWCPWATWHTSDGVTKSGAYVTNFINDSLKFDMTPVFTYYNMLSLSGYAEGDGEVIAMNDAAKMKKFFEDVKLFYTLAGKYPTNPVVLHFEPDHWGYIQQKALNNDATTVPAKIGSSGMTELTGLPDNAAGYAQAVVKLRDLYAPNVIIVFHQSNWGTGVDWKYGTHTDEEIISLGNRTASFFNSLNANYDMLSSDPLDRDAAYYHLVWNRPEGWWDDADYHYDLLTISTISQATKKRFIQWQVPYGNTKMRAQNNTNDHYQDNHVEKLLDDPSRVKLNAYVDAGVAAFMFGRGASSQSDPYDNAQDGVTNPSPITYRGTSTYLSSVLAPAGTSPVISEDGMTLTTPYAKDDDGGYFRWRAFEYYRQGAIALPTGGGTLPLPSASAVAPSASPVVTPSALVTPTPVVSNIPNPTALPSPLPSADTVPPTISINSPANGSTVTRNKTLSISATALDNIKVVKVEFRVNGSLICTDTTVAYSCSWKVPGKRNTTYTLEARAYDSSNNSTSSVIKVTSQ